MQRHGTLEIPEDVAFERRAWRVQRVGWAFMALVVVAAVLGLFGGSGPLASATASAPGFQLDYHRFVRNGADEELKLQVAVGKDGKARAWFAREFLERYELVDVLPGPEAVETDRHRVHMVFRAATPTSPVHVRIRARPRAMGRLQGQAGLEGGGQVQFTQVSYP